MTQDGNQNVEAQLHELTLEFERRRQAILAASIQPLRDELRGLEAEIAGMTNKADHLRAQIDKMLGVKSAKTGRVRTKRPSMSMDEKRAKIAEILREERVQTGLPVKAVADRFQKEANLTPADLSPKKLPEYLPNGISVEGANRRKIFVVR